MRSVVSLVVSLSAAALALSTMSTLLSASAARAEIGVITTVVEGLEIADANRRKNALDQNVETTLLSARIPLNLRCDPGSYDVPPDARCVKDAVAAHERHDAIDEVAQVLLKRFGPDKTVMKLRIFSRDGAPLPTTVEETVDEQAFLPVTTAMLRKAFDPSRFSGTAIINGAPADAVLLIDGLRVDRTELALRVGKHVLSVVHPDGAVETVSFEVLLDKPVTVRVPSALIVAPAAAGAPFYASASTATVGLVAAIGSVVLLYFASENRDEWRRRATGRTFPRNSDDPRCAAINCVILGDDPDPKVTTDDQQIGWTREYGPLGEDEQVGQGARFMMVAFSRDNELRWDTTANAAIGLAIASGAALVGGGVATFALWPADVPPE